MGRRPTLPRQFALALPRPPAPPTPRDLASARHGACHDDDASCVLRSKCTKTLKAAAIISSRSRGRASRRTPRTSSASSLPWIPRDGAREERRSATLSRRLVSLVAPSSRSLSLLLLLLWLLLPSLSLSLAVVVAVVGVVRSASLRQPWSGCGGGATPRAAAASFSQDLGRGRDRAHVDLGRGSQ